MNSWEITPSHNKIKWGYSAFLWENQFLAWYAAGFGAVVVEDMDRCCDNDGDEQYKVYYLCQKVSFC